MEDITKSLLIKIVQQKEKGVHSLDPTTSVVEEQSRGIRNTLDMIERVPTDLSSNFTETSTDGFPSLYVGDIDISLE